MAERLCDWIFLLNDKKASGHALLVADADVHAEMQTRVRLSAELAFESATPIIAQACRRTGKGERINNLFLAASHAVIRGFRWPWLWLEPDCVPLTANWLEAIAAEYNQQPKNYLGPILKFTAKDKEDKILLGRTAIYPRSAASDLASYCNGISTYNFVAEQKLVNQATKSKLFQQISYNHETDLRKIRPDAVLLHSDKTSRLIQYLRAKIAAPKPESNGAPAAPKKRRPPVNRNVSVSV